MDKIKAFFSNKITKIVSWIILALDVVALFIGGATEGDINNGTALTLAVVGALSALIAFISSKTKKEE